MMLERKVWFAIAAVILVAWDHGVYSKPRQVARAILDPNYVKIVTTLRKLEPKMAKEDLRMVIALGIVQGALDVKKSMEKDLTDSVSDLVLNLDMSDKGKTMPKIEKIEKIIERDRHSIELLGGSLDLARRAMTAREFHTDMKKIFDETSKRQEKLRRSRPKDVVARLGQLKREVLDHLETMRKTIDTKAGATLSYLERMRNVNESESDGTKTNRRKDYRDKLGDSVLKAILADAVEQNLIEALRRQDLSVEFNTNEKEDDQIDENESEQLNEEDKGKQGGLVGIIANLSGGEEGSDIGALFGAVTGVVMRLFGPNGLDIESLISSGTSLISGLLSGDKNFGTVLGGYVGTAVDGLSGGGGAINNGQFFGHFLGTVIARLSADPEDEDLPPKPQIFLQNFVTSFMQAKGKADSADGGQEDDHRDQAAGSDSFGFLKHVVRTVVGGVTSFVLNASLGSSGGSSQGSGALFSSSSHSKQPPKQPKHAEWND